MVSVSEDFNYTDMEEYDPTRGMTDEQRETIHKLARLEFTLLNVTTGDRVNVDPSGAEPISGTVTSVTDGEPHGQNPAVTFEGREDGEDYHLVVDYEGAFTSHFPYYVPYVSILRVGDLSYTHDVDALGVNVTEGAKH